MTGGSDDRWVEVTPSQFPHEAEGLALVRAILPDETPFRAWSNFEFRDSRGRWHEVDLLVLGRGQLHLIELKYYSGILRGDDHQWLRDGKRAEDSPLKLARRKAQYFASQAEGRAAHLGPRDGASRSPDERDVIPFVQESVFLHHPAFRCELPHGQRHRPLRPRRQRGRQQPPRHLRAASSSQPDRRAIGANQEQILVALMARIGLVQRREREAGSWIIEDQAIGRGRGLAGLARLPPGRPARSGPGSGSRSLPPGASEQERTRVRRIAEHEFRVMSRLQHDGLLRPRDLVESDLGVGLVYPYDESWQRLDLWLAGQPNGVPLATQLSIDPPGRRGAAVRPRQQGRPPRPVAAAPSGCGRSPAATPTSRCASATGRARAPSTRQPHPFRRTGVTSLVGATPAAAQAAAAPSRHRGSVTQPAGTAPRRRPLAHRGLPGARGRLEPRRRPDPARRLRPRRPRLLPVIAGRPAATNAQRSARSACTTSSGLDLAVELPQISSELRSLVLKATQPAP